MNTATRDSMIDDAFARLRQLAVDPSIPPETARRAAVDLIRLINHPPAQRRADDPPEKTPEPTQPHRHQHADLRQPPADTCPDGSYPSSTLHDRLMPDAEEISRILDQVLGPESPPAPLAAPPPPQLSRRARFKKRKRVSR